MTDFNLRVYSPGDEDEINQKFNEIFHLKRPIDEWRWKFSTPGAEVPILLGFLDGRLATQYAGIPVRFSWEGRMIPALQIVDVFSTKAARRFARRGYWVQTVDAFFERFGFSGAYPLLYGFPGRRALRLGVLQLGYDALEPQSISEYRREVRNRPRVLRRSLYRATLLGPGDSVELDRLWERVVSDYPMAILRDGAWLRHRYFERPNFSYHVFGIRPRFSSGLVGWVVFLVRDQECCWVDLLWDHRHPGALDLMEHLSSGLARQMESRSERLWLTGDSRTLSVLGRRGFEPAEELPLAFVARSFLPELDIQRLENRVYLTMGDTDLF